MRPSRSGLFSLAAAVAAGVAGASPARRAIDFEDPTYGARIRQWHDSAGDEHNLYHYRSVFNADNSRRLGIVTPRGSTDYQVTLYDAAGERLKTLFTQREFDWGVAWDRRDPRYFYTRRQQTIVRYAADHAAAEPLRTFTQPAIAAPTGLSLNQAGDRLLLRFGDQSVRTFRLPALDDERVCRIEIPPGFTANWDKLRFTGHGDTFALELTPRSPGAAASARSLLRIYDGLSGRLSHTFEGIPVGHHDFSPDGRLAYVAGFNQRRDLEVHVVNLDGTDDRIVFKAPRAQLLHVRNYHLTWPAGVKEWFLLSFFPQTGRLPARYTPWLDEIVQVFVDGRHRVLARTGTTCDTNFWTQPQQSISADGRLALFHSNAACTVGEIGQQSSGTLDECLLHLPR